MKFSLIICTYMRPQAVSDLMRSVEKQYVYPDEIWVIDASHDRRTSQILQENNFENLNYFLVDDKDRGLTKQRNIGISKADPNADVICFLDDDIILEEGYFQQLIDTYTKYPDAVAVGGYITNEVNWQPLEGQTPDLGHFVLDGFVRPEGSRYVLRKRLGLIDNSPPGYMPEASHGRPVGFLPPSNKIYEVEMFMGGVSSYRRSIFDEQAFSHYFDGYGLYEDADFCLRLAKKGKLYVNTSARCTHHHNAAGRPNKYTYGKMVIRNGWYVWRIKYPNPNLLHRSKWNLTALLLTFVRILNAITGPKRYEAMTESFGRIVGWLSLLVNKPRHS